jgi:hypothetical protein
MSAHPAALGAAKDIEIKCNCKEFTADGSACGDMFCHTIAKQEEFAVKKLTTPVRCPSCSEMPLMQEETERERRQIETMSSMDGTRKVPFRRRMCTQSL